jgi:endonuclease YncB( thermonuclease family)
MKLSALAVALTLAALPAFAESVRVVDGDTLQVDGVTYRLWGIDAPEAAQPCADGWPAGRAATEHLRALIGERHVTCEPRSVDRYGRTVAVCHVDGRDLGADMVTDGHGPTSDIAATTSRKNVRRQRFGPAYTDTHASRRGSGAPKTGQQRGKVEHHGRCRAV